METKQENVIPTDYAEVMQKSYIDYAMSVIISRALPDVRDGLKPVQRRTLYDMYELGIRYDKPYRKCARIVGDTMGKYHPHGDSSIYDSLVVMAQEFKKGQVLVDGHGNFGSIEGDGAAAMRYTEARLTKFTQEVCLADLDKNVIDFGPNFDETEKEPLVLPMRVPNLLINGAEGIAVGMATSIPTHNLCEVVDAVKAYMKNDKITTKQLMKYIKGPDFPTGGIVVNKDDIDELLAELRLRTPDEIKKYQKIIANKDAILNDAKERSEAMIAEATAHINQLVSEHEIMQKAYDEANKVIEQAQQEAQDILNNATSEANDYRMRAMQYTDDILSNVQSILTTGMNSFENAQSQMMTSLNSSLNVVVESRKELNGQDEDNSQPENNDDIAVDLM